MGSTKMQAGIRKMEESGKENPILHKLRSCFYKARPALYIKKRTTICRIPKNLHFNENMLKPKRHTLICFCLSQNCLGLSNFPL